jgi:hypothetical protein
MRVEAQHLSLNYGKVAALRDLSVDVQDLPELGRVSARGPIYRPA